MFPRKHLRVYRLLKRAADYVAAELTSALGQKPTFEEPCVTVYQLATSRITAASHKSRNGIGKPNIQNGTRFSQRKVSTKSSAVGRRDILAPMPFIPITYG